MPDPLIAYRATTEEIRRRALLFLDAAWREVELNLSDATVDRFGARAAAVADAAQHQVAVATDVYLAQDRTLALGEVTRPLGIEASASTTEALRGVPAEELWARPGVTVWSELSKGVQVTDAARRGLSRAHQLADTNMQLAHTHAGRIFCQHRTGVVGHCRVPRGGRSCALCLLAATQRYHKEHLMPIHGHCHCTVKPLYSDRPVPRVIDEAQRDAVLAAVKAATGEARLDAAGYKRHVIVHEHGEIGPVVAVRGQHFVGPSDLPSA